MARAPLKQRGGDIRDVKTNGSFNLSKLKLLSVAILIVLVIYAATDDYQPGLTVLETASKTPHGAAFIPTDFEENARGMGAWRKDVETECQAIIDTASKDAMLRKKEELEISAISKLNIPDVSTLGDKLPPDHKKYEYCHNAFMDLGTNIGDSIGYFVDNALDPCSAIWMSKFRQTQINNEFPKPHLDVTELKFYNKGYGNNPLFGMLQKAMAKDKSLPETFCVYGMEGNPTFTPRLQKLENFVMGMKPRPVRHLHIHTEAVVTAKDGPTKLYLDKTSVKQNFWGSSILSSQQDAQKSAKQLGNGTVFSADVTGISLSSLVTYTMEAFKPGATPEEKKGGLLIIKMDVEGAEYQVLKEIAASEVICDYINMGNRVVMIVEYHNMSITDRTERQREKAGADEAQKKLEACGVEFGKLHAYWH